MSLMEKIEIRDLGAAIARFKTLKEPYELIEGDWTAGGCSVFAQALHSLLPSSTIVGIVGFGQIQHLVVNWEGHLIDADGVQTFEQMLKRWAIDEGLSELWLKTNPALDDLAQIVYDDQERRVAGVREHLERLLSAKCDPAYLFTREHGYDWDDYEVVPVRGELRSVIDEVTAGLRRELLPRLGLFSDFTVACVRDLPSSILGAYVNGTWSHPYIALNAREIRAAARRHNLPLAIVVESTIVHETAHGIQEALGLDDTCGEEQYEDHAEALAVTWHEDREIEPGFAQAISAARREGCR